MGVGSRPGPECVFKWKYPVYPGNRHQAVMSDQLIAIRVLNKRCDFCASAVWQVRQVRLNQSNAPEIFWCVSGRGRMFRMHVT